VLYVGKFFAVMVYEGDVERGLADDARGNDDTRFRKGEEGGAQVDEKTPLKSQIPGQVEERYM